MITLPFQASDPWWNQGQPGPSVSFVKRMIAQGPWSADNGLTLKSRR